jgi:amidase
MMDILSSTGEPMVPSAKKLGLVAGGPKTMGEYFKLNAKRQQLEKIYSNLWSDNLLDAIIMPPAPHTTVPFNKFSTANYTAIWNLMDYPGFAIPVGQVEKTDVTEKGQKFYSEEDEELYKECKS